MTQFYANQSDRINDTIRSLNARDFDSLEQLKEVYNDNILTKSAEKIQDFTDRWTNVENLAEKEIIGVASFGGIVKGGKGLLSTIRSIKAARQAARTGGNVGEDATQDSLDVDDAIGDASENVVRPTFEPTEDDIAKSNEEADFDPTEDDIADASKSSAENAVEDTTENAVEDTVDQASGFTRDLDFENAMENLDPSSMSVEDLQSAYDEFDSYIDERDRATNPRETPQEESPTEAEDGNMDVSNFSAEQTTANTTENALETGGEKIATQTASNVVGDTSGTIATEGGAIAGEESAITGSEVVGSEVSGSIVGELVGSLSLSAIPVVGEVVAIVGGIAAAATAIAELFEKPKRSIVTPPDPSISNLNLQAQLSSKYSNAAPSTDSLDKVGGSSMF